MPLLRTEGIVLQTWDLGEHDRLVMLYTRGARAARRRRPGRAPAPLALRRGAGALHLGRRGRLRARGARAGPARPLRRPPAVPRPARGSRVPGSGRPDGRGARRLTAERDAQPACFALLLRAARLDAGASPGPGPARLRPPAPRPPRASAPARPVRPLRAPGRHRGGRVRPAEGSVVCARCRGPDPASPRRWPPPPGACRPPRGRRGSPPASPRRSSRPRRRCSTTTSRPWSALRSARRGSWPDARREPRGVRPAPPPSGPRTGRRGPSGRGNSSTGDRGARRASPPPRSAGRPRARLLVAEAPRPIVADPDSGHDRRRVAHEPGVREVVRSCRSCPRGGARGPCAATPVPRSTTPRSIWVSPTATRGSIASRPAGCSPRRAGPGRRSRSGP